MLISVGIPSCFFSIAQHLDYLGAFTLGEAYYQFCNIGSVEHQHAAEEGKVSNITRWREEKEAREDSIRLIRLIFTWNKLNLLNKMPKKDKYLSSHTAEQNSFPGLSSFSCVVIRLTCELVVPLERSPTSFTANWTDTQQKNFRVFKNKSQVCNLFCKDLYVLISW